MKYIVKKQTGRQTRKKDDEEWERKSDRHTPLEIWRKLIDDFFTSFSFFCLAPKLFFLFALSNNLLFFSFIWSHGSSFVLNLVPLRVNSLAHSISLPPFFLFLSSHEAISPWLRWLESDFLWFKAAAQNVTWQTAVYVSAPAVMSPIN